MILYVQRTGQALWPASAAEAPQVERLPAGKALRATVVLPRNGKFHRLSWAFFNLLADALNSGPQAAPWGPEDVKAYLLAATGRARPLRVSGALAMVPVSTRFEAMDQPTYQRFMVDAWTYTATDLAPWIKAAPQWPEIRGILAQSGVET